MKRILLIAFLFSSHPSWAQTVPADMSVQQRARADAIYREVRCPTCVAQSVADSDANLSKDMKRRIDALIVAGHTDTEVLDRLAATYGDDIRLRPRWEGRTLFLWAAPWVILTGGLAVVLLRRWSVGRRA